MAVQLTQDQLLTLIRGVLEGVGGGAAGAANPTVVAAMVGPMEPCRLGKDKLKRPKR